MKKLKQSRWKLLLFLTGVLLFMLWWTDPTPRTEGTIKVYDRNSKLLFEGAGEIRSQRPVLFEDVPSTLIDAVVVTEDQRFWEHHGVDAISITRAMKQNIQSGEIVSGASTITQQVVRFTVISPQQPPSVSLIRKAREIAMAFRLSLTSSKEEVLEKYINNTHFGYGTYGVGSSSSLYFDKDISELSLSESALLAALIANPSKYNPIENPEESIRRRNEILRRMRELDKISEESYNRAIEDDLPKQIYIQSLIAPHSVDMAIKKANELKIDTKSGVNIYTSIDSGYYDLSRKIALSQVNKLKNDHNLSNAAVVIIKNDTGEIISLLGSVDYFDTKNGGQNNLATSLRQPGSAMKPVTYAAAFESGIATAATQVVDQPKVYSTKSGEGFQPHNYDGLYRGSVLVREALASSYNMPAVEMLNMIGISSFIGLAEKMGVSTLNRLSDYDLALTLGGGEITLLELTNLYATFARNGNYLPAQLVTKIESDEGDVLYEIGSTQGSRALSSETSWLITDILQDSKARIPTFGEKNNLVVSKPAAVKTGTTTDWHDNWTLGYTKNYTVGVWVGNADNSPMQDITGETGAAPIWNSILETLIQFEEYDSFDKPTGLTEKEVCAWDGLLPTPECTERYFETFIEGTEPTKSTALTSKPRYTEEVAIQIVNPKQSSIFEISPNVNNHIVFQITNSAKVVDTEWFLDGVRLTGDKCVPIEATSCSWELLQGNHRVFATVHLLDGSKMNLSEVEFSVITYKQGWE